MRLDRLLPNPRASGKGSVRVDPSRVLGQIIQLLRIAAAEQDVIGRERNT